MRIADIDRLVEKVTEKAEQVEALRGERAELEKKIAGSVRENYEKIVMPELEAVNTVCIELYHIRDSMLEDKIELLKAFPHPNVGGNIELRYVVNVCGVYCKRYYDGYTVPFSNISETKEWLELEEFFGTEEKCLAFIEKIRGDFAMILDSYMQAFEKESVELSVKISELKAMAEGTHAIEEKEDGTIEIMLGGKLYTGRVKEA